MKAYITNKLLSFTVVLLCIFSTLAFFGYGYKQWQAILLFIIIFGYAHFFLGFYYQLKSFLQKSQPWQYFVTFSLLTFFSIGLAYVLIQYLGFVAALFIGFMYFLFHGMLNEQTLVLRQTNIKVPLLFMVALGIFVMSLLTYSVPDETFMFNQYLQFVNLDELSVRYLFEVYYVSLSNFTHVYFWGCVLSFVTLFFAWRRFGFPRLTLFLALTFISITGLVVAFGPPAYIYVYLFVVGYHFMTWLLFYLVEMKKRGDTVYKKFILHNVLILLPFLGAAYLFFQPNTPVFVYRIFDYNLFVVMTYIHISTSFLNDEWLQKLQAKLLDRFNR